MLSTFPATLQTSEAISEEYAILHSARRVDRLSKPRIHHETGHVDRRDKTARDVRLQITDRRHRAGCVRPRVPERGKLNSKLPASPSVRELAISSWLTGRATGNAHVRVRDVVNGRSVPLGGEVGLGAPRWDGTCGVTASQKTQRVTRLRNELQAWLLESSLRPGCPHRRQRSADLKATNGVKK